MTITPKIFRIGVLMLLAARGGAGELPASSPLKAVPRERHEGQRLKVPELGFTITAPEGWAWFQVPGTSVPSFVAAKAGESRRFSVGQVSGPKNINDAFAHDFLRGAQRRAHAKKLAFSDSHYGESTTPVPGSYSFSYVLQSPAGESVFAHGYLFRTSGVAFVEESSGAAELSEAFQSLVHSIRQIPASR